jgi:hypothetical protein
MARLVLDEMLKQLIDKPCSPQSALELLDKVGSSAFHSVSPNSEGQSAEKEKVIILRGGRCRYVTLP